MTTSLTDRPLLLHLNYIENNLIFILSFKKKSKSYKINNSCRKGGCDSWLAQYEAVITTTLLTDRPLLLHLSLN